MAGLLAWAADVVGRGGGQSDDESADQSSMIPLIFTPEQEQYARELDLKAASLSRSIQDLRLRIPPPDISQRLPDLHAHSVASNAALALQLNAHSSTREQAQQREVQLQEENAAYEKSISSCQTKIQEKLQEAELLQNKLKEFEIAEADLRAELENAQAAKSTSQSNPVAAEVENVQAAEDTPRSTALKKLEAKKRELQSWEATVEGLEKKWAEAQEKAMKLPSPAQREKALDKQLHSLIEQLASKQAQAEGLVTEIHAKEKELDRLNGLWRRLESSSSVEAIAARNRFVKGSTGGSGYASLSDGNLDSYDKLPSHFGGRIEAQQRLRLLRSSFVLYIFLLHILVFFKISF